MLVQKTNISHVLQNIYLKKNEPVSIVHFVTNRCNARCSFCFIDFDDPKTFHNELSLEEIEKLTKSMGKSLLNVNLTGGEPFARKDITEIAKLYIKNTTVQSIYVTTNASLPDRVESFAKEISSDLIRIYGYAPGTVDTDMQTKIRTSGVNPISKIKKEDHWGVKTPAKVMSWLCSEAACDLAGQE